MNRLKQLREERNLKQEDVAKLLHVEIAAISKYETGRVPLKDEYIKILSDYFNVSSDYLLGIADIRNPLLEIAQEVVERQKIRELGKEELIIGLSREEKGLLTEEDKEEITRFAEYVANRRKK